MPKFTVTRNYRSATPGRPLGFDEGAEVDVDQDVADWVNKDSPGTLEPTGDGGEPPRSGKGSGKKAWAAYAAELGVDVAEGDSRDDIIEKVDAATAAGDADSITGDDDGSGDD